MCTHTGQIFDAHNYSRNCFELVCDYEKKKTKFVGIHFTNLKCDYEIDEGAHLVAVKVHACKTLLCIPHIQIQFSAYQI